MSAIPADSYGVLLLLNASLIMGLAGGEGVPGVSGTPPPPTLCKPFFKQPKIFRWRKLVRTPCLTQYAHFPPPPFEKSRRRPRPLLIVKKLHRNFLRYGAADSLGSLYFVKSL